MICLTTGRAWFYNQRSSYANSLQVGGKIFEKLQTVKFLMIEIFTIALSLKDVELGLTSPMVGYAFNSHENYNKTYNTCRCARKLY